LLNVRRMQVETHNPILLSAQRSRPPMTHWRNAALDMC
jgi:hypothetical protein